MLDFWLAIINLAIVAVLTFLGVDAIYRRRIWVVAIALLVFALGGIQIYRAWDAQKALMEQVRGAPLHLEFTVIDDDQVRIYVQAADSTVPSYGVDLDVVDLIVGVSKKFHTSEIPPGGQHGVGFFLNLKD